MTRQTRETVSLALGSGGARGLAHIGIIEWLNAHGYRIESISGASMGSLVGGIYGAGELDAYKRWVLALTLRDVLRFVDFAFSGAGLMKGNRIIETLRSMVGDHSIEDLSISYTAVATDIERQREVWISEGSLFDAIRASIAVPGVFTPHVYRGMTLVDGGLLNPVPIAPTFRDFTDLTIAVNLNAQPSASKEGERPPGTYQPRDDKTSVQAGEEESDEPTYQERIRQFFDSIGDSFRGHDEDQLGVFDLTIQSFETMQNAIAAIKLAAYRPDVVINVPRDVCSAHEFHRALELIEIGHRLAEEAMGRR
jgi:NTE family protein